jgi:hypothetical protein
VDITTTKDDHVRRAPVRRQHLLHLFASSSGVPAPRTRIWLPERLQGRGAGEEGGRLPTAAGTRPGLAEKPRHEEVEGIKGRGGGHGKPSLRRHLRLRIIRLGNSQASLSGHGAWDGTHNSTEQICSAGLTHWLCTNTLERAARSLQFQAPSTSTTPHWLLLWEWGNGMDTSSCCARDKHLSASLKTRSHAGPPTLDGSIARANGLEQDVGWHELLPRAPRHHLRSAT